MIACIQGINYWQQLVLTREWVQVHDQGLGRFVQLSGSVEELATQGPHVVTNMIWPQKNLPLVRRLSAKLFTVGSCLSLMMRFLTSVSRSRTA